MRCIIEIILGFVLYAFVASGVRWILTVFGMDGGDAFVWGMFWPILLIGLTIIYYVITGIVEIIKNILG